MASALNRFLLFFLYWVAPSLALLVIIFGGRFQFAGFVAYGALLLFHLVRGKDYQGNPVVLGFRRDSLWWGNRRQVDDDESIFGKKRRASEHHQDDRTSER